MARISQSSLIKLDYFHQCLKTIDGVLAKDRSQNIWEFFLKISETIWELVKLCWNICKYLKVFENICKLITLDQGQGSLSRQFFSSSIFISNDKGSKDSWSQHNWQISWSHFRVDTSIQFNLEKENRSEKRTRKTGKTEAMNKRNRRERRTKMVDI